MNEALDVSTDERGPTRVVWLIKGLGLGGAERLLASFAEVRDRQRFHYEAWYLRSDKDRLVGTLREQGVTTRLLGPISPWDPRWIGRLRRRLAGGGVDVLHVHSPSIAAVARLVVRSLRPARRPALVTTEHNVWPAYGRITRLANRVTFPLDDAHLAVADETVESIPKRWRDQVEVIVHGVPVERLRAHRSDRDQVRTELGIRAEEVVVGTIANFRVHKAYPVLLRAAAQVIARNANVRFVAVGQGPLEQQVRTLRRELHLEDRFDLLGARDDATRLLAAFDVFVLASMQEGYPVALMEALAVGLPVVASDVGGVSHAIRQGIEGLLVPPNAPHLLAAAVERVVRDDGLRERMAAASVARSAGFDIADAVRRTECVYDRFSPRRTGPRPSET